MNLILSDVEETIMLVDGTESVPPGQGVVNVSHPTSHRSKPLLTCPHRWQRERWKCFSSEVMASFWCGRPYPSVLPDSVLLFLGIASFTGVTFLHWAIVPDAIEFCMLSSPRGFEAQHTHYSRVIISVVGFRFQTPC